MTDASDPSRDAVQSPRRHFLATGVGLVAALAGCSGGSGPTETATEPSTASPTPAGTDTQTETATSTPTERQEVVVDVAPNGEYRFEPGTGEAIRIGVGTTLRFVWRSSGHNVVPGSQPEGANWQGHDPLEDRGFEYTHTFDVAGKYEFWCEPHKGLGMVGSIVVE